MASYDELLCSNMNIMVLRIDYETFTRALSKHVMTSVHFLRRCLHRQYVWDFSVYNILYSIYSGHGSDTKQ